MKMTRFFPGILAICLSTTLSAGESCGPRSLALTFDDPPLPDTQVMTGELRTQLIINALRENGVDGAMFFSVSSRIDESNVDRMNAYAEAGHVIANHSHTHANLHNVGAEAFLEDVQQADEILSVMPGFEPYFRFPYLNEGNTEEQRDLVRAALEEMDYQQGYVTIDNYDFYIDRLIREAFDADPHLDLKAIGALYIEMMMGAAEHYDAIACQWLKRSPAHVLLLHENDAAALFLSRMINEFREQGWSFIPAREAFQDPISEAIPDTLVLGQGRVAALAAVAGAEPASLRHEGEDTEILDAAFQEAITP